MGTILDPGKVIFGHFIDFGHFPIEIPIEAEKFYGQQKEGSYIKNKNCFENRRPNGTIWNHVEIKIPNFVKIRITLPLQCHWWLWPFHAFHWDHHDWTLDCFTKNISCVYFVPWTKQCSLRPRQRTILLNWIKFRIKTNRI